jgi:hypothetical protein
MREKVTGIYSIFILVCLLFLKNRFSHILIIIHFCTEAMDATRINVFFDWMKYSEVKFSERSSFELKVFTKHIYKYFDKVLKKTGF